MRHRAFFEEAKAVNRMAGAEPAHAPVHGPKRSISYHAMLLVATLLPVVLLAEQLAKVIDYGIETLQHRPRWAAF